MLLLAACPCYLHTCYLHIAMSLLFAYTHFLWVEALEGAEWEDGLEAFPERLHLPRHTLYQAPVYHKLCHTNKPVNKTF